MKRVMMLAVVASVIGGAAMAQQVKWCVVTESGTVVRCHGNKYGCDMHVTQTMGTSCVAIAQ
ncbi:hypothetical protein RA28_04575 [Ruegeria sp. ANG-S4]|uniref:hypothetical protein n=1 Tax=Ruegeria sp. ANG-S4 TaxID=1577904 RepID=UPI00057C9E0A|nr:hypothetical protein [Ruegeria sp. ANG-S4]KIC46997.1 hypothetical protein RA28_04575 [Ruegeria sp. ANG-S4]